MDSVSGSMDRFICRNTNFTDEFSGTEPRVYCVYGAVGSGKTTWIKEHVKNFIEIDDDILKNKDTTLTFIERIRIQKKHVVIDNFDALANSPGASYFVSKPVTKQSTFLVSATHIDGTVPIHIEGGDRRPVLFDARDEFNDPIQIIREYMTTPGKCSTKLIDDLYCEHGNIMGYVHENYTSSTSDVEKLADIVHSLSDAMIIDDTMYTGAWELMPFFINSACSVPCLMMNGAVKTGNQASLWTRHMNACMRRKQFKESRLDLDRVDFLSRTGNPLKFYNIDNKNGKRRRRSAKHSS